MQYVLIGSKSKEVLGWISPGYGHDAENERDYAKRMAREHREDVWVFVMHGKATLQDVKWEEL